MKIISNNYVSYGFLFIAQAMVAINIVAAKVLLADYPIFFILLLRFTLASLFLFLLHFMTHRAPKNDSFGQQMKQLTAKDWQFLIAQGLCAGALFNCLLFWGLQYTNANLAGIITSALPAIIVILSLIFLRERLTQGKALCVSLAVIGLCVVNFQHLTSPGNVSGDLIILLSLLPEAAYYILIKLHPNRLPVFLASAIVNAMNIPLLLPLMLWTTDLSTLHFSFQFEEIILLMSFSSGAFYVFWCLGCHAVNGTTSGLFTAIMPLMTLLIAWAALHETITSWQFVGMLIVITSVAFNAIKPRQATITQ